MIFVYVVSVDFQSTILIMLAIELKPNWVGKLIL